MRGAGYRNAREAITLHDNYMLQLSAPKFRVCLLADRCALAIFGKMRDMPRMTSWQVSQVGGMAVTMQSLVFGLI